ncbi:hypothetical protein ALC53_05740 [Atta colombica]|uniref:Uncharacterized protein n=1 Tax=Atta colombica TaxID=520822 RepID=A0A195BI23_9HYME|nr:hypothetical protein ALC53_05740 [Atta colombica]
MTCTSGDEEEERKEKDACTPIVFTGYTSAGCRSINVPDIEQTMFPYRFTPESASLRGTVVEENGVGQPLCKDWILSLNCKAAFSKFNARSEGSRSPFPEVVADYPTSMSTSTDDATAVRTPMSFSLRSFRHDDEKRGWKFNPECQLSRRIGYHLESNSSSSNSGNDKDETTVTEAEAVTLVDWDDCNGEGGVLCRKAEVHISGRMLPRWDVEMTRVAYPSYSPLEPWPQRERTTSGRAKVLAMNDVQDGHENSKDCKGETEGCQWHVLDELCSDWSYTNPVGTVLNHLRRIFVPIGSCTFHLSGKNPLSTPRRATRHLDRFVCQDEFCQRCTTSNSGMCYSYSCTVQYIEHENGGSALSVDRSVPNISLFVFIRVPNVLILEVPHRYPSGFNVIFLSCRNILQQRSRGCRYSNKLRNSDKRKSEYQNVLGRVAGAKKKGKKRMEGARESDVVGRTKENSICTGSQPNPTSSNCRKDGSERVKATWFECHPLRNRP